MHVLHANWSSGSLRVWAESLPTFLTLTAHDRGGGVTPSAPAGGNGEAALATIESPPVAGHRFAAPAETLIAMLGDLLGADQAAQILPSCRPSTLPLQLPAISGEAAPSERLASAAGELELPGEPKLGRFDVPCLVVAPAHVLATLIGLESVTPPRDIEYDHDLRFWLAVGRFAVELLTGQRFIPTLIQSGPEGLHAQWQPWLHDESARSRIGRLITSMPPSVRAVDDDHRGHPWSILDEALGTLTNETVRRALIEEDYIDAIDGRDPQDDTNVAWLAGLLGQGSRVDLSADRAADMLRDVGGWVGRLDDRSRNQLLRLCLRLSEPVESETLEDLAPVADTVCWRLSLHLTTVDGSHPPIDAEQIWGQSGTMPRLDGLQNDSPAELLLTELERAGRIYAPLEAALGEEMPVGIDLTTAQAHEFLSEYLPLLVESDFEVDAPTWWSEPTSRIGARLQIDSDPRSDGAGTAGGTAATGAGRLGLKQLVRYRWQVAVGDQALSPEEFERLGKQTAPLVRVRGRWVPLQAEQLTAAVEFLSAHPGGEIPLLEAIQLAHGGDGRRPGLPILGMDASGWVRDLLEATSDQKCMPSIKQPEKLLGTLRPYQETGLSWLAFLDELGLGACLADDMGLGKTIQLIALLQHERRTPELAAEVGPTLLLVPTSLIGNWTRELERFAPELPVHVHHGPERPTGEPFARIAEKVAVVITTYGLVARDRTTLDLVRWHRVVLDEAQYIKNPPTKQTVSIRALRTERRVALTGTPVENRLSELWSIMEFCNPGYLGPAAEFRRRFSVPIERHRDPERAEVLRELVRPFILRRLKTDPLVIDDLPPCVQTREYATLTPEQAAAYQLVVDEMLSNVDGADGIQRRGLVLSTLVRLKQICDHPVLVGSDPMTDAGLVAPGGPAAASRSGKAHRLVQMLEEVLATGDRALVFTQFRRMGHLLAAFVRHEFDREPLFLHGGTPQVKRQQMIDRFQDPASDTPVFILSLKAGGVGLNLTAATHVFHFDRWWNPAVENQATDRAFRIGQTRTVHVHKFVCVGTLEERIDQMIEQKMELAQNIIGSGEHWLTELSTSQLRDVLTLRQSAMEIDS